MKSYIFLVAIISMIAVPVNVIAGNHNDVLQSAEYEAAQFLYGLSFDGDVKSLEDAQELVTWKNVSESVYDCAAKNFVRGVRQKDKPYLVTKRIAWPTESVMNEGGEMVSLPRTDFIKEYYKKQRESSIVNAVQRVMQSQDYKGSMLETTDNDNELLDPAKPSGALLNIQRNKQPEIDNDWVDVNGNSISPDCARASMPECQKQISFQEISARNNLLRDEELQGCKEIYLSIEDDEQKEALLLVWPDYVREFIIGSSEYQQTQKIAKQGIHQKITRTNFGRDEVLYLKFLGYNLTNLPIEQQVMIWKGLSAEKLLEFEDFKKNKKEGWLDFIKNSSQQIAHDGMQNISQQVNTNHQKIDIGEKFGNVSSGSSIAFAPCAQVNHSVHNPAARPVACNDQAQKDSDARLAMACKILQDNGLDIAGMSHQQVLSIAEDVQKSAITVTPVEQIDSDEQLQLFAAYEILRKEQVDTTGISDANVIAIAKAMGCDLAAMVKFAKNKENLFASNKRKRVTATAQELHFAAEHFEPQKNEQPEKSHPIIHKNFGKQDGEMMNMDCYEDDEIDLS